MSLIKSHKPSASNHHSNANQSFVQQTVLQRGQNDNQKDNQTEQESAKDVQLKTSPFGAPPLKAEPFVRQTVFVPAKLNIGQPNDKYEVEADRVADKVVSKSNAPAPPVQKKDSGGPEESEGVAEEPVQMMEAPEKEAQIQEKPISESITTGIQLKPIAPTEDAEVQKMEAEPEGEAEVQMKLDASTEAPENIQKAEAPAEESDLQKTAIQTKCSSCGKTESAEKLNVQQKCASCEGEEKSVQKMEAEPEGEAEVQTKSNSASNSGADVESSLKSSKGKGSAMDDNTRSSMESGFGADFSGVRIHTDSNAVQMNKSLGSQAFANGSDLYFNEGKYNPSSKDGQHLLAHELTHTVQQGVSPKAVQQKEENDNQVDQVQTKPDSTTEDTEVQKLDNNDAKKGQKTERNPFAPTSDPFFKPLDRTKERSESEFKQENEQAIRQQLQKETGQAAIEVPVKADSNKGKPTALDATDKNKKKDQTPELEVKSEEQAEIPQNDKAKEQKGASKAEDKKENKKDEKTKNKKKSENTIKEAPEAPEVTPLEQDPGISAIQELNNTEPSSEDMAVMEADHRSPDEILAEQAGIAVQFSQAQQVSQQNIEQKITAGQQAIFQREMMLTDAFKARHIQKVLEIKLTISEQKNQLKAGFERTRVSMEENKTNEFVRLEETRLSKIELLKTELETRRIAFNAFVDEQTAMPTTNAKSEADRADSELEKAAKDALAEGEDVALKHPGSDDGNPEARESVREIASETSADIRKSKSVIREDLMNTAADFNGGFEEYRTDIIKQTKSTEEELTKSINEAAESFKSIITKSYSKIASGLTQKEESDLQKLSDLEETQIKAANKNAETGIRVVKEITKKSSQEIDTKGALTVEMLNTLGGNVTELLSSEEGTPNLPAMREFSQSSIARLQEIELDGENQIDLITTKAEEVFNKTDQANQTANTEIGESTRTKSTNLVNASATQREEIMAQLAATMEESFTSLETALDEMRAEALVGIDEAIEERKGKMLEANSEFLVTLIEQNEEGIKTAKQPLTDPLISRLWSAADRATASWWEGLLAAIGDFLLMLIIIVAFAALLVVAGLFSSIVGALMAIGLVLLAGMFLISLGMRLYEGHGWASFPLAIADTLGITMIYQGVMNKDIATGEDLGMNTFDRWYSGTTGTLQFVMILSPFKSRIPGIRSLKWPKFLGGGKNGRIARVIEAINTKGKNNRVKNNNGVIPNRPPIGDRVIDWVGNKNPFSRTNRNKNKTPQVPKNIKPGDTIIVDDVARLAYTEPTWNSTEGYFEWKLYDTETGATFTEYVHADNMYGPDMYLRPKDAYLDGVGRVNLESKGAFRWTEESIRLNFKAYESIYGQRPPNLNGSLAEANRTNFQWEYAQMRTQYPGESPQFWADKAIRNISFGKHRITAGYGKLSVNIKSWTNTVVTPTGGSATPLNNVPLWVEIIALPSAPPSGTTVLSGGTFAPPSDDPANND